MTCIFRIFSRPVFIICEKSSTVFCKSLLNSLTLSRPKCRLCPAYEFFVFRLYPSLFGSGFHSNKPSAFLFTSSVQIACAVPASRDSCQLVSIWGAISELKVAGFVEIGNDFFDNFYFKLVKALLVFKAMNACRFFQNSMLLNFMWLCNVNNY